MPEIATDKISCRTCDKSVGLSRCARCHAISYCSVQCQRKDWPRHKYNCLPVLLTAVQGKGRGLVATKEFKKGDLIFTETAAISFEGLGEGVPVLRVDLENMMSNDTTNMNAIMDQVMALSDRERLKLLNRQLEGGQNLAKNLVFVQLPLL